MKTKIFGILACALFFAHTAFAADHLDAPEASDNPLLDITDVFVFKNPEDPSRLVIAVALFTPVGAPDSTRLFAADTEGSYGIFIDTNGDAVSDETVKISFDGGDGEAQTFRVEGLPGSSSDITGNVSSSNVSVATDSSGGTRAFAGLRDDHFFFDLEAFRSFLSGPCVPSAGLRCPGTGSPVNFFNGLNVSAIVVDFPLTALPNISSASEGKVSVWANSYVR